MHCEQRNLATEVNWVVRMFSVSWHQALKRMKMHCDHRKLAIEDNWLVHEISVS
jgi:hypothetical protein